MVGSSGLEVNTSRSPGEFEGTKTGHSVGFVGEVTSLLDEGCEGDVKGESRFLTVGEAKRPAQEVYESTAYGLSRSP